MTENTPKTAKKSTFEQYEETKSKWLLLTNKLQKLSLNLGYAEKKKGRILCECEHATLICLKHGTILGSEVCPKCDGVRGVNVDYIQ